MDAEADKQKSTHNQRVSWLDSPEHAEPATDANLDPFLNAAKATSERLEIIEQIGKGGMAVVYKARHLVMNKPVAVKLLLPHLTSDPISLKRFQQEAQATATLNHNNIVRIYDCGLSNGQAFIIMDFIEGTSLEQVVRKEALTPERAVEIFIQICEALNHAHEKGIIHRDLKPSNVMLTTDKNGFDVVKVVDFGIAKLLTTDDGQMNNLTQTGDVFGSPLYMSPEQCAGKRLDSRSDVYSLGCLMYEALTGNAPIVGANFLDTMQKHLTDLPEPFPPALLKNPLAKRLQTIVFTCLAKEPSARYGTMKEVVDALRNALVAPGTKAGGWSEKEKSVEQLIKKSSAKKRLWQKVALLSAFSILVPGALVLISDISRPSQYKDEPIFEIVDLSQPQKSPTFDQDDMRMQDDKATTLSAMPSEMQRLKVGSELGNFYRVNGEWKRAIEQYLPLTKLEIGLEKGCGLQLYMGQCYFHLHQYAEAKARMKKALVILSATLSPVTSNNISPEQLAKMLRFHNMNGKLIRTVVTYLAAICERERMYSEALVYMDALRNDDISKARNPEERSNYIGNLSVESARDTAFRADLLRLLPDNKAIPEFQNALALMDDTGIVNWKAKLELGLGLSELQAGKFKDAATELKKGIEVVENDASLKKALHREYCRALLNDGQWFQSIFEKIKGQS